MEVIKNGMIVIIFGILLVGMMFMGVIMIEAKAKKENQTSSQTSQVETRVEWNHKTLSKS